MQSGRVIVTGAGGYIGPHVVRALLDRGHRVAAVVRPGSAAPIDPRAEVVEQDILAEDFSVKVLGPADGLVHLAWKDGFRHNSEAHMLQLSAHYRLITEFWANTGKRVVALGTMHEVGYWEGAVDEATPTAPLSQYGVAKDALRRSLAISAAVDESTSLAWARCFYIYGDDRRNNSIFAKILQAADRGDRSFPFTSGKNAYDFIRVDDLGRQIAALYDAADITGIINCSSGEAVTLGAKVEEFILENRLPISLDYGAFPDRSYDSPATWGDAARIREIMAASGPVGS